MTELTAQAASKGEVSAEEIRAVKFGKVIGRGYEQNEVDAFVAKCAAWIDWFNQELQTAREEVARLGEHSDDGGDRVQQAIQVLTNAQQTADTTVRQADQYSLRVMSEAKQLYEEARVRTADMEQEAKARAESVWDEASLKAEHLQRESAEQADALLESTQQRAASIAQQAEAKAAQLLADALDRSSELNARNEVLQRELDASETTRQAQLDQQTAYLRTLRDSSRDQLQQFLEGMLDQLAQEYGRADPAAEPAATETHRPTTGGGMSRRLVGRPKRGARLSSGPTPAGAASAAATSGNGAVPPQRTAEKEWGAEVDGSDPR